MFKHLLFVIFFRYFKAPNDSHTERLCGQSETVTFAKLSITAADSKDSQAYSGILSLCKCCFGQIWFQCYDTLDIWPFKLYL